MAMHSTMSNWDGEIECIQLSSYTWNHTKVHQNGDRDSHKHLLKPSTRREITKYNSSNGERLMIKHQLFKLLRIMVIIEHCGKYSGGEEVVVHVLS